MNLRVPSPVILLFLITLGSVQLANAQGRNAAEEEFRPKLAYSDPAGAVSRLESELKSLEGAGKGAGLEAVQHLIDLGWAHLAAHAGDEGDTLDRALFAFDQALNAWTDDHPLSLLGMAHVGLGQTYAELSLLRDPKENIKAALNSCDEAVVAFIRVDNGYGYALTQAVLARVEYAKAIAEPDADHAGSALKASTEALRIFTPRDYPVEFARTEQQMGAIYSFLASQNPNAGHGDRSLTAFRAAREIFSREGYTPDLQRIDRELASLATRTSGLSWDQRELSMLDREGSPEKTEDPEEAGVTTTALVRREPPRPVVPTPAELALDKLREGYAALKKREAEGSSPSVYEEALEHFNDALRTFTRERDPIRWAEAQSGLGASYWGLRSGPNGPREVERCIESFQEALEVYDREDHPEQFAITKSHLGAAFHYKARSSAGTEEAKQALDAYEAALKIWSAQGRPIEYARLCNSVADLYLMLSDRSDPERYAELAIRMLGAAVEAQGREVNPTSFAESKAGMGRAYYRLARSSADPARFREAISANNKALQVYRDESMNRKYSSLQGLQGTIYLALSYHENRKENVEKSVKAYKESLETMPVDASQATRGTTHINLGTAYFQLAQMEDTDINGNRALLAFRQAQREVGNDETHPLFQAAAARSQLVDRLLHETREVLGNGGA